MQGVTAAPRALLCSVPTEPEPDRKQVLRKGCSKAVVFLSFACRDKGLFGASEGSSGETLLPTEPGLCREQAAWASGGREGQLLVPIPGLAAYILHLSSVCPSLAVVDT